MLDAKDKKIQLAYAFGMTIQTFTQKTPMTAEDIIEALCFCAGHACGQKEAHSFHKAKELRNLAVAAVDRGLDEAKRSGARSGIIMPTGTIIQ